MIGKRRSEGLRVVLIWVVLSLVAVTVTSADAQVSIAVEQPRVFAFDVASIHPDDSGGMGGMARVMFTADRYDATHVVLQEVLKEAFGIDNLQLQGAPPWIRSESFSIDATTDRATQDALARLNGEGRKAAQQEMLQKLLAERFGLVVDRERKELPIYSLRVAKRGSKLHEGKLGDSYEKGERWSGDGVPMGPHNISWLFVGGQVRMVGQAASMDLLVWRLSQNLSHQLGRKIVDETGLTGTYDFDLRFKVPWPPNAGGAPMASEGDAEADGGQSQSGPGSTEFSLFAALQDQLGLKLESPRVRLRWWSSAMSSDHQRTDCLDRSLGGCEKEEVRVSGRVLTLWEGR